VVFFIMAIITINRIIIILKLYLDTIKIGTVVPLMDVHICFVILSG